MPFDVKYTPKDERGEVDFSSQLSLDQKMTYESAKSHKALFDSMDSSKNVYGALGMAVVAVVLVAAVAFGWTMSSSTSKDNDIPVSSQQECGNYQVKVYTANGYYCEDCESGEYGKLDMCEENSETGECTVTESGCFVPISDL